MTTVMGVPLPSWNAGIPANRIPKFQSGTKQYICLEPNCQYEGSSNMDTVRGHYRKEHSKVPLQCPNCDATFYQRQTLGNHLIRNICPGLAKK